MSFRQQISGVDMAERSRLQPRMFHVKPPLCQDPNDASTLLHYCLCLLMGSDSFLIIIISISLLSKAIVAFFNIFCLPLAVFQIKENI